MRMPAPLLLASCLLAADGPPTEVRGTVADAQGRPIPGVEIYVAANYAGLHDPRPTLARATTDADGHFRFARPPRDRFPAAANSTLWAFKRGVGLAATSYAAVGETAHYRLVLDPQPPQVVAVSGPDDAPMEGVRVTLRMVSGRDERGQLGGFLPDDLAERTAQVTGESGTAELPALGSTMRGPSFRVGSDRIAVHTPPRSPQALFSIALRPAGGLAGSVVGEDGRPVAGAILRVESTVREASGPMDRVSFRHGLAQVGADGRFRPEGDLLEGLRYRVIAMAPGYDPRRSDWLDPAGEGKTLDVPPLVLKTLLAVSGSVVDRQGRPIPGAEVIQAGDGPDRSTTEADGSGRFRLGGFRPGPALIMAHAPGFRFGGRVVAEGENAIVLTRLSERPERAMTVLPPPIPRDELRQIARAILAPELEAALGSSDEDAKLGALHSLARIDPAEALRAMRSTRLKGRTFLPGRIARSFAERGDLKGAEDAIRECDDPAWRGEAMLEVADVLPPDRVAEKLDYLGRARDVIGELASPAAKVSLCGEVSERLLELGRGAEARGLFSSGQRLAEALPPTAPERIEFAAQLAGVDLPAALRLIEPIPGPEARSSAIRNAAVRLATSRPEECERLLRDYHLTPPLPIFDRMAASDPARALRLASQNEDPRWDARRRLLVAYGLARSDRPAAVRICREAIQVLETRSSNPPGSIVFEAMDADLVEEIDPGMVPEYLWMTLSDRQSAYASGQFGNEDVTSCRLAAVVARYDREIAAVLFAPAASRIAESGPGEVSSGSSDVGQAYARLDPRELPRFFAALAQTRKPTALGWLKTTRLSLSAWLGTWAGPGRPRSLEGVSGLFEQVRRRDAR